MRQEEGFEEIPEFPQWLHITDKVNYAIGYWCHIGDFILYFEEGANNEFYYRKYTKKPNAFISWERVRLGSRVTISSMPNLENILFEQFL